MTPRDQRLKYAVVGHYPTPTGTIRQRFFPCFTCRDIATSGCVKRGHLVGEAPDVLPEFTLARSIEVR